MIRTRTIALLAILVLLSGAAGEDRLPEHAIIRIGSTSWRVPDYFDFAISGDSKTLALPTGPRDIRILDAVTGATHGIVSGPAPAVGLVLHPEGKLALVREDFDRLALRDLTTGKVVGKEFLRKDEIIGPAVFAPDGKMLAVVSGSGGKMKDVTAFATSSARAVFALSADVKTVTGLTFSPDGATLATVGSEGKVILWDGFDGTEMVRFSGPREPHFRSPIAFSADGKSLVSAAGEQVCRFDIPSKAETGRFILPGPALAISSEGSRVVALVQGKLEVRDTTANKLVRTLGENLSGLGSVRFAPDGSFLVAMTNTGLIRVWDLATGDERSGGSGHLGPIQSLQFLPDGKRLLSASTDNTARLWDATTGKELVRLGATSDGLQRAVASADGKLIAAGGGIGTLSIFDGDSGKMQTTIKDAGQSLAFAPDGKTLASLSPRRGEEKVRLLNPVDGVERGQFTAPARPTALLASRDGSLWAVGTETKSSLIESATGKTLHTFEGSPIGFAADGKSLATLDRDGVQVWDVAKGSRLRAMPVKGLQVTAAAWSPDGQIIALAQGTTITLFDATGREVGKFRGHENTIDVLSFAPDGRRLASAGKDTTIVVWKLQP